jgi:hypothetical protein
MMCVEHCYKGNCCNAGLVKGASSLRPSSLLRVTLDFKNTFSVGLNIAHLEPNMVTNTKLQISAIINVNCFYCLQQQHQFRLHIL